MAANTPTNSATTNPKPKSPNIAEGTKEAIAARIANIPAIIPNPIIPSVKTSTSILPRASATPCNTAISKSTTACISSGALAVNAPIIPISIEYKASTIAGAYSAIADRTPNIS